MNKNDEYGFRYIEKKIQKNGTFIGTQNAYNKGFSSKLNKTENNTFFKVCHSFLGVTKAHNQREIIWELLSALGCNMQHKINFDFFFEKSQWH